MTYQAFNPAPPLRPYIERYWFLSGYVAQKETVTLMPDGGVTLVLNLGESIHSKHLDQAIGNESLFLVGAMLHSDEQILQGQNRLFGIQFRPGAFTHFYQYESMDKVANQVQGFQQSLFPNLKKIFQHALPYVNQFFLDRFSPPRFSLIALVKDIEQHGGQVKLGELAKRHFSTERQLERQFRQQIGVSPKEFVNLTRFQHALRKVQQNGQCHNLSDIAWECGYYDHAHMSNDFKRYTGTAPSSLILSDFSKSIAS